MKNWLAVCGLLVTTLALPASASSPVSRWSDGDWWEAQLEHVTWHHRIPRAEWTPSFRLRFQVTRSEQEVRVEVSTIPENRFQERLILRYTPSGELLSAQIVEPDRVQDLPPVGGMGFFGSLGRQAFTVTEAPVLPPSSSRLVRVPLGDTGTAATWGSRDAWWLQYETPVGMPQRLTLVDASWRRGSGTVGEGTVVNGPDGGIGTGPGSPGEGNGASGGGSGTSGGNGSAPTDSMIPLGPEPGGGTPPAEPGVTPPTTGGPSTTPTGTTKPAPVKKKKGFGATQK
jgi:endonuclease YncB( thermonuclease family)